MILEGEFFSGGHLRWNLGWPTPNYAGAFLVTLLTLAFVFSGSRWRWAFLAAEAGGLLLLAKTYSRGAVVAWGLAWLFGVVAVRGWKSPAERLVWAARAGGLMVMMLAVGFGWSRAVEKTTGPQDDRTTDKRAIASEVPSTEDGSVVNRLALWRGGLKMIAAAPLTGWGAGESGRAYMNWYQDVDRDEGYTTMVNSYLHVAVEHGLPVLAAVLWVGVWLLLVAWKGAGDESASPASAFAKASADRSRLLQVAAGASLVAWAVANVFTTLWIEPKLWIVPAVAALVLVGSTWKISAWGFLSQNGAEATSPRFPESNAAGAPRLQGIFGTGLCFVIYGLVIAVFTVGGLYGAGRWQLEKQAFLPVPGANGSAVLISAGSTGAVWHAWPDPVVLGSTPGKELRRWLENGQTNIRLVVHRAEALQPGEVPTGAEGMLLFGRQAERVGSSFPSDGRELWLIHPTVPPPVKSPKLSAETTTVILPQIDETGNGPVWREWAKQTGARVVESPACGLDIRAVWPAVLKQGKSIGLTMR